MTENNKILYREMYRIRRFEETVLDNFSKGVFFGTTHTYLGQEANAVGVLKHLHPGDAVVSNHRCHGHFLAYGGDVRALFAELMGKETGVCGGRGGSQHLQWENFYSNGILGGTVPIATGMALAEKEKGSGAVCVVFIGDGTLGEGVVYESLNMASLWGAPVLYVVENNKIAQTTPIDLSVAGEMIARFRAFDIPTQEIDTSSVMDVLPLAGRLLDEIRETQTPRALIIHTCRFGPHSKRDDTRTQAYLDEIRTTRDPLTLLGSEIDESTKSEIEKSVDSEIEEAFASALADPFPSPSTPTDLLPVVISSRPSTSQTNVLHALNHGLHDAFTTYDRVHIIGEDILDPYGGAFKVSRGLSNAFPTRVHTSPISEAGITGIAAGMALRGLLPVVEIMFGDFSTLIADQVINHIAKFRAMYNEQVTLPLVIRTPMGGRRGYGATHSQTLEKLFLGVPGLRVIAPSALKISKDPGDLLAQAILDDPNPVFFVENKLLYLAKIQTPDTLPDFNLSGTNSPYPTYSLSIKGAPPAQLTIAAYGYMAELAREAVLKLAYEFEIFSEVIVPTQISPFEIHPVLKSLQQTQKLLVVEEGTRTLGWGAEMIALAAEAMGRRSWMAGRVAAAEGPIPASGPLEEAALPGINDIVLAGKKMV